MLTVLSIRCGYSSIEVALWKESRRKEDEEVEEDYLRGSQRLVHFKLTETITELESLRRDNKKGLPEEENGKSASKGKASEFKRTFAEVVTGVLNAKPDCQGSWIGGTDKGAKQREVKVTSKLQGENGPKQTLSKAINGPSKGLTKQDKCLGLQSGPGRLERRLCHFLSNHVTLEKDKKKGDNNLGVSSSPIQPVLSLPQPRSSVMEKFEWRPRLVCYSTTPERQNPRYDRNKEEDGDFDLD
uniref:Uncharacterized protein n=1 Tax=Nelumbo nucifera TaxID=4432 RepID=A0A822ZB11_NELNU|nr:TPA_asm: hypothetical protein HUJ06_001684 [Nelumbo nucifera]